MEYVGEKQSAASPKFGIGRVSQVIVRTPYNVEGLVVLRADGTAEVDAYNEYVASPVGLLKGVVFDAMEASGRFSTVVNASSSVVSDTSVEVLVTRLALDCRNEGERKAVAALVVRILKNGEIVGFEKGEGESDAADGKYGAAFSRAVSSALSAAFGQLD